MMKSTATLIAGLLLAQICVSGADADLKATVSAALEAKAGQRLLEDFHSLGGWQSLDLFNDFLRAHGVKCPRKGISGKRLLVLAKP